ncbi:MAG: Gfo/Idh/MocA family oxidoreductase, partial [Candidatus Latescibacteria bacterium]|nr:Gfo/Idh/MocA family oxidoreductase [Candidatus Latescibacterota bacterium]
IASHAGGYVRDTRIELTAAVDPDPESLARFGRRWDVGRLYATTEEMLVEERPDIVSVCTWDEAHGPAVAAAASAGVRAILCEKPLGATAVAAAESVRICADAGTELFVGYQRRWDPAHCAVRDYVTAGMLGDVLAVNGYYVGGLRHNGCAWINLARFLVGEIEQVQALPSPLAAVDGGTIALGLGFAGGASGSLHGAKREAYSIFEIDIMGTEGRVRFSDAGEKLEVWEAEDDPRYPGFRRLTPSRRRWLEPQVGQALYRAISSVVDWTEGTVANASSGADAVRDMELFESVLAAGVGIDGA